MRVKQSHLDPLRRIQLNPFQIRIISDETDQFNEITLAEQQIILVEAELSDTLLEAPFDLLVGAVVLADPYFSPLVKDVRGTVSALKRAAAAGGQNCVVRGFPVWFRLSNPILHIQFQVERERIGLRNSSG